MDAAFDAICYSKLITLSRLYIKMPAYNDFLSKSSLDKFKEHRQALVSERSRGNLLSGNLAEAMDVASKASNAVVLDDDQSLDIDKIFLKKGKADDWGFIFDIHGTEKALKTLTSGGLLKLYDDFVSDFRFKDATKRDQWANTAELAKKRAMTANINQMIKKTEVNYRTHGDRLHYFTVGRITVTKKDEILRYPLFLFSCINTDKRNLSVEVETSGFLNFWLDKSILEDEISKKIKGFEVTLDESFPSLLNDIAQKLSSIEITTVDKLEFDPTYSSIGIITGFEPEYIDPVWKDILGEHN